MRVLLGLVLGATVLALAFWAYQENYRTREVLAEVRGVQGEIGRLQEQLSVLRAEWAYLNRPDRLRELADLNFPRLGLLPMTSAQFGRVTAIPYPAPEIEAVPSYLVDGMPSLPNKGTEDGLPPPGTKPIPPSFVSTALAPVVDEAVFEEVAPLGGTDAVAVEEPVEGDPAHE